MATRSTNTMSEALQRVLSDLTAMKTMPDADVAFLLNIETQIVSYLRKPYDDAGGQMPPGGGMPAASAPPPSSGQMPMGAEMLGGGFPSGQIGADMAQGIRQLPNPDEFRRSLAGRGQA